MKSLRTYILEVIRASQSYMKKEEIRERLEDLIKTRVANNVITSQDELDQFFDDVNIAARALKGIPFSVFVKLSKK